MQFSGSISRIIFQSDDSSFAIVRLDSGEKVVGYIPGAKMGITISGKGIKEVDSRYGEQVNVESVEVTMPVTADGLASYFQRIDKVGPTYAKRMADYLSALDHEPGVDDFMAMVDVVDVHEDAIVAAMNDWRTDRARRKVLVALEGMGLSASIADKAFSKWGVQAPAIVKGNPYSLCKLKGVGFKTADQLAKGRWSISFDDPHRLAEGVNYCMDEATGDGHTGLPREDLADKASRTLSVIKKVAREAISNQVKSGRLVEYSDLIQPSKLYQAELNIAKFVASMTGKKSFYDVSPFCEGLTDEQASAVDAAINRGGLITLTGGPGTGKTFTVRRIKEAWEGIYGRPKTGGLPIHMAAPTGRAAKRMEQVSLHEAKTIHRLMGCQVKGSGFEFSEDKDSLVGLIIIDESSMVDTDIMSELMARVSPDATLLLVGDPAQLPSVKPGYVFGDILKSGKANSIHLTKIHRQAEGSEIVKFSYNINRGQVGDLGQADDFSPIKVDSEKSAIAMVSACYRRLEEQGYDLLNDVQTLCPMKRTADNINSAIQGIIHAGKNPKFVEVSGQRYFIGDRVMMRRNDYDFGFMNGDIGHVTALPKQGKSQLVEVDIGLEAPVTMSLKQAAASTMLAYAITIHKSQGSEYPVTITVMLNSHHTMHDRTLLYTAITRTQNFGVLIYQPQAIMRCAHNYKPVDRHRALIEKIKEAAQ